MVGDYISREAAITAIGKPKVTPGGVIFDALKKACQEEVRNLPAADVVPVVRCRECIFWDTSWNPGVGVIGEVQYCPRCQLVTLKDSFCSGAYRKEGGQGDV